MEPCRTLLCWVDTEERVTLGPELVQETTEKVNKIKKRLKIVQSRQKSYADPTRREVEFYIGDRIFLKVSPMHEITRFGVKGKLDPRYIGPFEITNRIGPVAYRLDLPPQLGQVHNVFHVSILRKYIPNPSHNIPVHGSAYPKKYDL